MDLSLSLGRESSEQAPVLHLFGGPYVTVAGERRDVPEGGKRLLALLALRRERVERRFTAGLLWPFGDDQRAAGNLRSALWRLRGLGLDLVMTDKVSLRLREDMVVDAQVAADWAYRLIDGTARQDDLALGSWFGQALDLLPGWYDDWAILERERLRQRVLHALEGLSRQLCAARRYAEAVEAAMVAVGADPIRESAQRALIEAHLAEGNLGEARRAFAVYRELIHRELSTEPSARLADLLPQVCRR
ncbi:SARP family transcriptional regulator [Amycolatopsis sp. H6(2020)]|nr:SARP family transcriptional regulator [Amycolatopsis sp. H6(2020)]